MSAPFQNFHLNEVHSNINQKLILNGNYTFPIVRIIFEIYNIKLYISQDFINIFQKLIWSDHAHFLTKILKI